jgi:hypothetical protein
VNLIEVDDISAQPPERIVDLLRDAGAAAIAERLLVLPIERNLGGQHHASAPAAFR